MCINALCAYIWIDRKSNAAKEKRGWDICSMRRLHMRSDEEIPTLNLDPAPISQSSKGL